MGIARSFRSFGQLIRSMRPKQWIKNLLLFAGLLFSHNYTNPELLVRACLGFVVFCFLSGSIYIFNDIVDIDADRHHPRKKFRPLAAGNLSMKFALFSAVIFALGALIAAYFLSQSFAVTAAAYFVITILYSHIFKNVTIVDVILLASGFVLRAVASVVVIQIPTGPDVPMTPWFVICVLFLALFIAVCKRRHEIMTLTEAGEHRKVLQEYNTAMLDQMISVCTSATLLSYTLYLVASPHGTSAQNLQMLSTLPLVIYGVFRYLYLVYKCSEGGEPESLVLKDKPLLLATVAWLALAIYLRS